MEIGVAAALCLVTARPASAGTIYKWYDEQGDLHATDQLTDVPEPYRSMYAAAERKRKEEEEKRRAAAAGKTPAKPPPKAPPPPPTRRVTGPDRLGTLLKEEEAKRKRWTQLVAHWRAELQAATRQLQDLDQRIQEVGANPILRQTPKVKKELAELQEQRKPLLERLNGARRMLAEELPKRARREEVPPQWLE